MKTRAMKKNKKFPQPIPSLAYSGGLARGSSAPAEARVITPAATAEAP